MLLTADFVKACFSREPICGPVLEIGSGRNRFNRELFSKKYRVVTTNIYPRNRVDHISSVTCLPFRDSEFGCIICEHVLEHVEEPGKAIEEMVRVLKPGGLFILIVPFSWPIHDKPYDLWRFTEEGIRHLAMKHFENAQFVSIGAPNKPRLIGLTARKPAFKKTNIGPKVSIIMPTYNRAHMIGAAIESVLNQTLKDWELIIVSDGSTDNTKKIISTYKDARIRFFRKKHGGPASARNYGLKRARGEYIGYCDDDDPLFAYHLENLAGYLDRHPEIGLVRGDAVEFQAHQNGGYARTGILWSTLHRRSQLQKVGLFDENLLTGSDIEFILRYADHYPAMHVRLILSKYTHHDESHLKVNEGRIFEYNDLSCRKRVKQFFSTNTIPPDYCLMLARFLMTDKHKALLEFAGLFVRQNPGCEADYLFGWTGYRCGKISEGLRSLRRVLSAKMAHRRVVAAPVQTLREFTYGLLAWIYAWRLQDTKKSIRCLTQGLRVYPRSLLLKAEIFYVYLFAGNRDKAEIIYEEIKHPFLRAHLKKSLMLIQGSGTSCGRHQRERKNQCDKIIRRHLHAIFPRLYPSKIIKGLQRENPQALDYFWLFPIFGGRNFTHIDMIKMKGILSRIFLLGEADQKQIIISRSAR